MSTGAGPERAPALYRLLLRAFPRDFREQFGREMEAVFAERLREADRSAGRGDSGGSGRSGDSGPARHSDGQPAARGRATRLRRLSRWRPARLLVWLRGISDLLAHALAERASRWRRLSISGAPTMGSILQDLRFAARGLRRSPGFTAVAVATLALGIGATTVVFSILHSVLWRPLPYPDGERLVVLRADMRDAVNVGLSPAEVMALRERSRSLDALESVNGVHAHVDVDGEHEYVSAASVTDGFLALLGVGRPALGRTLREEEDLGDPFVRSVVISHALWQRSFGGDPSAVGRQITVNNLDVQLVGILPSDFRVYLPPQTLAAEQIDVWFPTGVREGPGRDYPVVGRLAPGVTLAAAQAELDALARQFTAERSADYPGGDLRFSVRLLHDDLTAEARTALYVLAVAVGFVLLIACMNVANLLLARGKAREREIAVRQALGAGRLRVARQLLTESFVLAAAAAGLGLLLAAIGVNLLDWLRPVHLPRQSQVALNQTVVLFGVALSATTTLLFGVLPALRLASGRGPARLSAGRSETAAPAMRRLQRALVVGQVALSIIPLVGAGLMLRTLNNLMNAPLGFDPTNVLTAHVGMSFRQFPEPSEIWTFFDRQVLPAIRELPGVRDASAGGPVPFGSFQLTRRYGVEGRDASSPRAPATQQSVLPGYLRVMGIPLREGRDFTVDDLRSSRRVVIVDQRIARRFRPASAVGQRVIIETGRNERESFEIIGVTDPVRVTGVRDGDVPHFFIPHSLFGMELTLVVETTESAATLGPAIKRIVEPHTRRAVHDVRPMSDYVADSIVDARFNLLVLLGFAVASLLLAGVGLHGTLAYLISQRTRELGLRVALGAPTRRVIRMVVGEGTVLVGVGVALGLAGAIATTGVLRGLLYGVEPFDFPTLLLVCALMAAVALAASWLPALRATRVDPMTALRTE